METAVLPTTLFGWISTIGIVVVGIFAILDRFDKTRNERKKLMSQESSELITLLQQKIEALEDRVKTSEGNAADAQLKVTTVLAENKTLREVLQGRDAESLAFQKQGFEAMRQFTVMQKTVSDQHEEIKKISENTASLADSIKKVVEQNAQTNTKNVTIKT